MMIFTHLKKTVIFLPLLALCFSCIDRMDFIGETIQGQLVISGTITDLEEVQRVTISRTRDFGLAPEKETEAEVTLLAYEGNRCFSFNPKTGDYELEFFHGTPGYNYALQIELDGQTYLSTHQTIPLGNAEDELSFSFGFEPFRNTTDEMVFTVYGETKLHDPSDPIFLRWQVEETYLWLQTVIPCTGLCPPPPPPCFISGIIDPYRLNLFDGSGSSNRQLRQVMGKRMVDNSFLFPFFVTVKQYSISPEAFTYWEQIKITINNQGSLFDIPPAPVKGNIRNLNDPHEQVLGYFEAAKVTETRIFTTSKDVPFYLPEICRYLEGKPLYQYPPECLSCSLRAGGNRWTTQAPAWWKFD
jgi:hypothetical protein